MSNPSLDRSFGFPADVPEPGLATRAWRFSNVVWLAAYVYAGYKGTQLWTRFISDSNKAELFRRQDLRAAQALNRTALRLEGLLIKACQFIATRADVLPDEWVSTLSGPARSRAAAPVCDDPRTGRARTRPPACGGLRRVRSGAAGVGIARAGASGAPARRPSMRGEGAVSRYRRHRARRSAQHDDGVVLAGEARARFRLSDPDARGAQVRPDGAGFHPRGRQLRHDARQLRRRFVRAGARGLSRIHDAARAHDGTGRGHKDHRHRRRSSAPASTSTRSRRS